MDVMRERETAPRRMTRGLKKHALIDTDLLAGGHRDNDTLYQCEGKLEFHSGKNKTKHFGKQLGMNLDNARRVFGPLDGNPVHVSCSHYFYKAMMMHEKQAAERDSKYVPQHLRTVAK